MEIQCEMKKMVIKNKDGQSYKTTTKQLYHQGKKFMTPFIYDQIRIKRITDKVGHYLTAIDENGYNYNVFFVQCVEGEEMRFLRN